MTMQTHSGPARRPAVPMENSISADDSPSASACSGATLAQNVREALDNSRYPLGDIEVEVRGHAVYLSGTVPWDHQRVAAHWEVDRVPGVHVVHSDIRVRARCSAIAVTSAIREALNQTDCGQRHDVYADVDGGVVTISGSVCSYAEWLRATHVARALPRVESVQNNLVIAQTRR